MAHNRKLVIGGAALTEARNNQFCIEVAAEIMDELEPVMIANGFLNNAPFKWVGVMLRFGLKNEETPHYQRINKRFGDLPVAIELDAHELQHANREKLKELFLIATLKTLVDIARKYNLPGEDLAKMLQKCQSRLLNTNNCSRPD